MPKTIHIDGRTLEGGGQLLRLSIALSSLTQQPIKITDIRGNRHGGGGLKLQHLTGVQWLSRACGASTRGAEKKSKNLEFWSKDDDVNSLKTRRGGWITMDRNIDIGSPGAVGLVLQAILPYILFGGQAQPGETVHITIKGGTNVSNSPSIDYIEHVLLPMLEKVGIPKISIRCGGRGWSTGRTEMGSVTLSIKPFQAGQCLPAFQLSNRGDVTNITAICLGPRAAEKLIHLHLKESLQGTLPDVPVELKFELSGHEKRLYILLVAHTSTGLRLGRDHLYQERISSLDNVIPKLVSRAVDDLNAELDHGGCVDEFMRDQLAVFQTLAKGKSEVYGGRSEARELIEPSLHAKTAIWVIDELVGVGFDDAGGCEGLGWTIGESWAERVKAKKWDTDVENLEGTLTSLEVNED